MKNSQTKVERLHEAGIIISDHFSDSDKRVIEEITDEEIEVLLKLRRRMGHVPEGKEHMRPNICV